MINYVNLELRAQLHHVSIDVEAQFGLYAVPADDEPRLIGAVQVFFRWDPMRGHNLRCLPTAGVDPLASTFLNDDQLEAIDFELGTGRGVWVRRCVDDTIVQPGGTLIQTFGVMLTALGSFKLGMPRTQVCHSDGTQVLGTAIFSPFAPGHDISKTLLAGRCDVKGSVSDAAAATEAAAAEALAPKPPTAGQSGEGTDDAASTSDDTEAGYKAPGATAEESAESEDSTDDDAEPGGADAGNQGTDVSNVPAEGEPS